MSEGKTSGGNVLHRRMRRGSYLDRAHCRAAHSLDQVVTRVSSPADRPDVIQQVPPPAWAPIYERVATGLVVVVVVVVVWVAESATRSLSLCLDRYW